MTILWLISLGLLYIVLFTSHEAIHVVAMRETGLEIEFIQFGSFKPYITLRLKWLPAPLRITPFPFTARVQLTEQAEEQLSTLSYRKQAWVLGGGVVMNLIAGLVLMYLYLMLQLGLEQSAAKVFGAVVAFGCLGIALLIWRYRRQVSMLVLPLGILGIIVLISQLMYTATSSGHNGASGALHALFEAERSVDYLFFVASVLSLLLGIYNAFPFAWQDGGSILTLVLGRWFGKRGVAIAIGVGTGLWTLVMLVMLTTIFVDRTA
jgi:hypothetical protein